MRFVGQGAGDGDALRFPAGQFGGGSGGIFRRQIGQGQQVGDTRWSEDLVGEAWPVGDIIAYGTGKQGRILEDHAHLSS